MHPVLAFALQLGKVSSWISSFRAVTPGGCKHLTSNLRKKWSSHLPFLVVFSKRGIIFLRRRRICSLSLRMFLKTLTLSDGYCHRSSSPASRPRNVHSVAGISSKTTAIDRKETVPYINADQINLILPYLQNLLVNPILERNKRWDLPTVSAREINVYWGRPAINSWVRKCFQLQ